MVGGPPPPAPRPPDHMYAHAHGKPSTADSPVYTAMQSALAPSGSPVMRSRSTTVLPHARRPSSSQCTGVLKRAS